MPTPMRWLKSNAAPQEFLRSFAVPKRRTRARAAAAKGELLLHCGGRKRKSAAACADSKRPRRATGPMDPRSESLYVLISARQKRSKVLLRR